MKTRDLINFLIIVLWIVGIIILRGTYFGHERVSLIYEYAESDKGNEIIEIAIPKFSFGFKENSEITTYKNIRSKKVLTREMNEVLEKYKKISCNDKEYYYNEDKNFTLLEYRLENKIFYNLIIIKYELDNYCESI